jgi:hypothetical protein
MAKQTRPPPVELFLESFEEAAEELCYLLDVIEPDEVDPRIASDSFQRANKRKGLIDYACSNAKQTLRRAINQYIDRTDPTHQTLDRALQMYFLAGRSRQNAGKALYARLLADGSYKKTNEEIREEIKKSPVRSRFHQTDYRNYCAAVESYVTEVLTVLVINSHRRGDAREAGRRALLSKISTNPPAHS